MAGPVGLDAEEYAEWDRRIGSRDLTIAEFSHEHSMFTLWLMMRRGVIVPAAPLSVEEVAGMMRDQHRPAVADDGKIVPFRRRRGPKERPL